MIDPTFTERVQKTREKAHAALRAMGYKEDVSHPAVSDSDRLWYRRLSDLEGDMHIHIDEFGCDRPAFPRQAREGIREGHEVNFNVGTWTNTPQFRFAIQNVRIQSIYDIKHAEWQVEKFIEAFELTSKHNVKGDGLEQTVVGVRTAIFDNDECLLLCRMPLLREKCIELCPEVLSALEEKCDDWDASYEVFFTVKVPSSEHPLSNASCEESGKECGDDARGRRLNLLYLVPSDDVIDGEIVDGESAQIFDTDRGPHEWLREEIELGLDRAERSSRDALKV